MKITLPLPPNMANGRFHWRVKHNKRKAYFEACDILTMINGMHIKQEAPSNHTKIKATVYCGGLHDVDNLLARMKWSCDWLVSRGYLVGDDPSHLSWEWPIEQVVKRKQQYRVEFELEAA